MCNKQVIAPHALEKSPRLTKNNFDLLRLLFAGTVCLVHARDLSGFNQLNQLADYLSSSVAVKAFFVVSGFLIVMSFEKSSSLSSYFNKRIRRIYPAYFTVVMLCAIGLISVSSARISDYFSLLWIKYVVANLSFMNFLQPNLPEVFIFNKLTTINGALWTLKIEVMFYLIVPFLVGLFRLFKPLPVLLLIYLLSINYAVLFTTIAERTHSGLYLELSRQLPGQLCYFIAGAFFYYFLSLFERKVGYFLITALLILVANRFYPLTVFEPFALATLVMFFGLFLYLGHVGKYGDFSYGVYILHFPIIQLLLNAGWFAKSPWYFLLTVVIITLIGAVAMWHLVEKRFLLRSNHYIATNTQFC